MPIAKKEKTLYRHILNDAWRVTWRRKELWVFGFFAAFAWGGGAVNYISDMATRFSSGVPFLIPATALHVFMANLVAPAQSTRVSAIVCTVVIFALLALVILASITSVGAILHAAARHGANERSNFRKDLAAGGRSFWRIFGITLVCRLIAAAFVGIVGLTFTGYTFVTPLFLAFYIVLFAAACVASLFLWFASSVAAAAVVLDDLSWTEALVVAYNLLVTHWLVAIEMTVVLFAATIAAAAAIAVIMILLSLPFAALVVSASLLKSNVFMYADIVAGAAVTVAVIALVGSALSVFTQATWASLYVRLRERRFLAKLERLFAKMKRA
jgi:hypothetical protein